MNLSQVRELRILGNLIRESRGARSQAEIAELAERSESWLNHVEHGTIPMNLRQLQKLAAVLQWTEEEYTRALALAEHWSESGIRVSMI